MQIHKLLVLGLCLLLFMPPGITKETVGWVEKVRIYPGAIELKAKIDSGAKTSSLNCSCPTPIRRHGEQWVTFAVTNYKGEKIRLKRKIERISKIKRHFGDLQERYVIKLGICLGTVYKETEVNLIDRVGMNYQFLVGRSFLKDSHVIDPSLTFATKPSCKVPE